MKTEKEVHEANRLVNEHTTMKYLIARYDECSGLGLYLIDDDHKTQHPHLAYEMQEIGRNVLVIAQALIEARMRELGIDPDMSMDGACFECGGTGRRELK